MGLKPFFLCLTILVFFLTGCKKDPEPVSPGEPKQDNNLTLKDNETALLAVNDISVNIDRLGILSMFLDGPFYKKSDMQVFLSSAGLWIAASQNSSTYAEYIFGGLSNFSAKWDTANRGVFYADTEILKKNITNWPSEYGAPVDLNGKPLLYGDAMSFSCLKGIKGASYRAMDNPVENLRITQSAFAYKRPDLSNVLFVRYELKNTGTKDLNYIYAGYYTDTDLTFGIIKNSIGYDASRGMTYTYFDPNDTSSGKFYNYISGCAFLESPFIDSRFPYSVSGHRMVDRDYGPAGSQFGEMSINSPVQVLNTLKALGIDGSSMIDPTTKSPTKFAFSGNPVTGEGWLDQGVWDRRNLLCTGPFDLKASESKVITVAMITVWEKNLNTCLEKLRSQTDLIRNERTLWLFPASKL